MRSIRLTVTLLAAAALAAVTLPTTGVANSAATGGVTSAERDRALSAAAKVGKWTRLSERNVSSLSEPHALALGSGGLQVIWYSEDSASSESIRARIVKENGRVGSPIVSVVKGWSTLVDDPKIINYGSAQRMVVFGGIRSTAPGEKFYGPMAYATSSNGTSWTLGSGSLTETGYAYASYGTAAVNDGGVPLVGVVASSTNFVTLHRGISPSVPAPSGDWTTNQSLTGNTYSASLGRDLKSGATWAVWVQDFGTKPHSGILAQRVYPTTGGWLKAPASTDADGEFLAPDQGVAVASRAGGEVWAAYKVGYPTANKIRLWRVGSNNAGFTVRSKDVRRISLLPGPNGRLWLAWYTGTNQRFHVARTNADVTKLGIVRSLKPPTKRGTYSNVWATGGSGRGGPLHLVINAQIGVADPQIWYQKVLPGLTLTASPRTLNKGRVVARVTDAGAPVAGAKVRFLGKTKTTRANGKVVFKVGASVGDGRKGMSAAKGGYARGHAVVRVT